MKRIIGTYNEDGTPNAMNTSWGGQWDAKEIMICMSSHATTENLARCADFTGVVSAKSDPQKMQKTGLSTSLSMRNILEKTEYLRLRR